MIIPPLVHLLSEALCFFYLPQLYLHNELTQMQSVALHAQYSFCTDLEGVLPI